MPIGVVAPEADLPAGLRLQQVLSRHERGAVLAVERGGQALVLRVGSGSAVAAEVALFGQLRAPGLVPPLAWGLTPAGRPYVLRPRVEGRPFAEAWPEATPEQRVRRVLELLATLAAVHAAGLVHRDVKSDNVLVGAQGVFLVDLEFVADAGAGGPGAGSAFHVAPEVLFGRPHTPAADLFSLGAMIALAACGAPGPQFARDFPRRSFWEASGLDPERIDEELRPLVRQLVRRHPADRPASAAAAAQLLAGEGAPPLLELPALAGREAALHALLDSLRRAKDAHGVLVLSIDDDEETGPLFEHLQLRLMLEGRRALRADGELLADGLQSALPRLLAPELDAVLVRAGDLPPGEEPAELVLAALLVSERRGPRLLLAAPSAVARELGASLRRRPVEEDLSEVVWQSWARPGVAMLERHLLAISAGASPAQAAQLARSLHRRTGGRLADVNRLLARAVEDGVLRLRNGVAQLLRDEWPEDSGEPGADHQRDVAALPEPARRLLAALAALDEPASTQLLCELADLGSEAAAPALAELAARGVLQAAPGTPPRREASDRRWTAAAWAALDEERRRELHARCAATLERHGAAPHVLARHRLAAARRAEELLAALDVARTELLGGRAGRARELLERAARHPLGADQAVARRRALLAARLELAQGHTAGARAELSRAFGEALEGAPVEALLLAGTAAEQGGRRDEARALFQRALDGAGDRAERLRALTGLGYGQFLDGQWDAALATIADAPQPGDPDEAVAGLLNLRGVALTRLQRHDEAQAALDEARERALAAGDRLAAARADLNRAHLDRRRGRLAAAGEALRRAAEAFEQAGHVPGRALALNNLGALQRDLGELRSARALLGEALALRRRAGDAHGAASSLGSLALAELEAGQVGAALGSLARARELLARGDYEVELALVETASAAALALAGRHLQAAERIAGPLAEVARREHPVLLLRATATVHAASGQRALALQAAREAVARAAALGDAAEEFRARALLVALQPGEAGEAQALRETAARLDAPVRRTEAALRTLPPEEAARAPLDEWLAQLEAAGRTDLVVVAARAAATWGAASDSAARAQARARAAQAADALADGLPPAEREATLQRVLGLVAPRLVSADARPGLTLDWFLACNRRLAQESDLRGLLLAILDLALDLTGARRGLLVLLAGDVPQVEVARGMDAGTLPAEEARFSRGVVLEAVNGGRPVLTTDAAHDARFASRESISSLRLRSVLCVPLRLPEPHRGALYLDDDRREAVFDEEDLQRLAGLADQAAVAITNLRHRAEIEALNHRLAERVERQSEELERARTLLRRRGSVAPFAGLVGESEAMQRVCALIERLAPTELPVLVTGPSGSGKDLVARALHEHSARAAGPLVVENISALPATLLESELFGHVRGAFTGADRDRPGLFQEAHGGTFFLDEIGEMPMELQAKLLRVLESGELRPVGGRRTVKVDVRIVAATNRDLPARVREGQFREDLFYRLNAAEIRLPPLAERLDDIPLLAQHFLDRLGERHGARKPMAPEVLAALARRAWPGQVRELSNEMSRLYFLSDATITDPGLVRAPAATGEPAATDTAAPAPLMLEEVERAAIVRALAATGQRKDLAARLLGISRAGLYAKLKRYGLETRGGTG